MKFQRIAGRLAAAMMTGAVLLSTFGGNALAATEVTPLQEMKYKKIVTTDGHTYAPDTSFSFTLTPVDHSKDTTQATFADNVVLSGVEGGLTMEKGTITFAPSGTAPAASYEGSDNIKWDITKFTRPGVYHYQARETAGNYEGIVYDGTVYDVYVFVLKDDTGSLYVKNILCTKPVTDKEGNTKDTKADLIFTNDYGKEHDTTHDITIVKKVTGNMGETNKDFRFHVKVKGADGEWYKVVITDKEGGRVTETHLENNVEAEYTIKDTGSIHIYGLTAGDTYTVNEQDYTADGYTTKYVDADGKEVSKENQVTENGKLLYVENHRDAKIPGGVVSTVAPYALMLAFAAAMIFFFGRKKKLFGE